ncbi:RpiB/LacA/LacB family sugar-phosphate isomerase [Patescibacteria group bacterium]|nr:RpiB/LacA/LacB family sugar-phosphate isomerase [Patescibacteria group bacterium]MCL5091511.1 RpiB/LacA/LacB family sugar-phosphate isomerase [Patescibacteria group bacterium]
MTIFFGADHRGFELKNKLMEYLQEKDIRVQDLGNYQFDPEDDNPDFAHKVAIAVQQNLTEFMGILICGSGVGMSIVANRYPGIRAVLGFETEQIRHARENDHVNVLALPSDYVDFEKAKLLVDSFIHSQPKAETKYIRRAKKMDEVVRPTTT